MLEILIHKLTSIMEQEYQVYNDILEVAKNKTEILIQGKVDELKKITEIEQALIVKVGKLEIVREELVGEIAKVMGQVSKDLTVSEIVKHIAGDAKKKLKTCVDNITVIVKKLNDANQSNQELINQSLDYINFSINMVSNTSEGNTYSGKGRSNKGEKKNFLDIKL